MKRVWSEPAREDFVFWQAEDAAVATRIVTLLRDARRSPFSGLGKPEPLKGPLAGWWSRRITGEHRLVYRVRGEGEAQAIEIAACRHHY